MNRTIKFRVWDSKRKKIFNVSNISFFEKTWLVTTETQFGPFLSFEMNKSQATLSQFTGLLDKNGKEIYEGDLLEELVQNETSKNLGICKQVLGGWKIFNAKDSSICWHGWKQEIIGNIFENPELLN